MREHFVEANRLVASVSELERLGVTGSQTEDLIRVVNESVVTQHRTRMALKRITSVDQVRDVIARNGTAQATTELRTPEWFEEHGP